MAAFAAAAFLPVEGVELDVHLTKDGEVVVIHDESIHRTSNGKGYVKDYTLSELKRYDFGSWFHKRFALESIPTLREVLELFEGSEKIVNIELKNDVFDYPELEEKVIEEIKRLGMEKQIIISSFNHRAIAKVARLAPQIENAALCGKVIENIASYQQNLPTHALHVRRTIVETNSVKEAIQKGSVVRVWTVNKTKYIKDLKEAGVDAIFTDEPEKMFDYLRSLSE